MGPLVCTKTSECPDDYWCDKDVSSKLPWPPVDSSKSCGDAKDLVNAQGLEYCLGYRGGPFWTQCMSPEKGSSWDWCKDGSTPDARWDPPVPYYESVQDLIVKQCGDVHVTPCPCACIQGS
jgi:hypothetical protein